MSYQVIVGNIGTVYDGGELKEALKKFKEYKTQSKDGYGRAAYEEVTLMERYQAHEGMESKVKFEFRPKLIVPTVKELYRLIVELKKSIGEDYRASEDEDVPGMCLTIGCSYDKSWSYQTGDNSYSGGAYHHRFWGVGHIYRNSNSMEVAREIINDVHEQTY